MRLSTVVTGVTMIGLLCLAGSRSEDDCTVSIRLIDADTGRQLPGLLRISDADGKAVKPNGLLSRGLGLPTKLPINRWSVLPGKKTIHLPRGKLTIEALSGLETELATVTVDLANKVHADVSIPLTRFYNAAAKDYRSGNTHLHLMRFSREESDRYLQEVPKADGVDVVFLSYLERAGADKGYISNRYTDGDLASLSRTSGVVFGNGEEHRHNFGGGGEGFGHVMFLNIKQLIQPVSIGPGIMKLGTDGIPLQRGIDAARTDGATILWCHNAWGLEALPNVLTGRIDAQNIFDGGSYGSYKDTFYRYLNAGLRMPFSTGTDWFIFDFSRVYVRLEGDVTPQNWLAALVAGRSYITNGPFLEFRAADKTLGETVSLKQPGRLPIEARALSRTDFGRIELVQDGKVVARSASRRTGGHFEAVLSTQLDVKSPGWLALRTPPPPVKDDPEPAKPVGKNELGKPLFAHTSPIYVEVAGRRHFNETIARQLLANMQANSESAAKQATFADAQERQRVLDVYRDAIAAFRKQIEQETR